MHEVTFLGHKCTGKIILPDDKIIQSHMMRTALADLLHFVIFTDGKDVKFEWTTECQNAFEHLKSS